MLVQCKEVILVRDSKTYACTTGLLIVEGKVFYTLERPWLNNGRNVSCIPAGEYEGVYLDRSASGKYKNIYHLRDVPDRSGILIHNGNVVTHTRGCILVGKVRGYLYNMPAVLQSRTALGELVDTLGKSDIRLRIYE